MRVAVVLIVAALMFSADVSAQRRRVPARRPAPKPPAMKIEPARVTCPESVGTGVRTHANYCFVLAGRDVQQGVLVTIPAHTGVAKLLFDLHNPHTYSEELVRSGRAYSAYTAVIGVLTMKGELLDRGAVQSEFRTAADLYERISGGAGPGGVKAVAPVGREAVTIEIPADVTQVSLLGEILDALTTVGREAATPGRPVALVSNVRVEYRPAPAKKRR